MQKHSWVFRTGCILLLLFGMVVQIEAGAKIALADNKPQQSPPPTNELRFVFLVNQSQNAVNFAPQGNGQVNYQLTAVQSAIYHIVSFYCDFLVPVYEAYNHVNTPITGQKLIAPQMGISVVYFHETSSALSFMRNGQKAANPWIEPSNYCGNAGDTYDRPDIVKDAQDWLTVTLTPGYCEKILTNPCVTRASNYVNTLSTVRNLLTTPEGPPANRDRQVGLVYLADGFPCGSFGSCDADGQVTAQEHVASFQTELDNLTRIPTLGYIQSYLLALNPLFSQAIWDAAPSVVARDISGPLPTTASQNNELRLESSLIGVVNALLTDLLKREPTYGNVVTVAQADSSNLINFGSQPHISNLGMYQVDPLRQFLKVYAGFSLTSHPNAIAITDPTNTQFVAQSPNAPLCEHLLSGRGAGECWDFPYPINGAWQVASRQAYVSNYYTCAANMTVSNLMCNDSVYIATIPVAFRLSVAGSGRTSVYEYDKVEIEATIDVVPGYSSPPEYPTLSIEVHDLNCESPNCLNAHLFRGPSNGYNGVFYPSNLSQNIHPIHHEFRLEFLDNGSSVNMPATQLAIDVFSVNIRLDCALGQSVGNGNTFHILIILEPLEPFPDYPLPALEIDWRPTWSGGLLQQSEPDNDEGSNENSAIYIFSGVVQDSDVTIFSINPIMPDGSPGPQATLSACEINAG